MQSQKSSGGGVKWFLAIASVLLAAFGMTYAMGRGQEIDTVSIDGLTFRASLSQSDVEQKQAAMESRVSILEGQVRSNPLPASSSADFNGAWNGSTGCQYLIYQVGGSATLSEVCPYGYDAWRRPMYGTTAYGAGQVQDNQFTFDFTAINGVEGVGQLQLLDQDHLSGWFQSPLNTDQVSMERIQ